MARKKTKTPEQKLRDDDPMLFRYIINTLDSRERKEREERERRTIRIEIAIKGS